MHFEHNILKYTATFPLTSVNTWGCNASRLTLEVIRECDSVGTLNNWLREKAIGKIGLTYRGALNLTVESKLWRYVSRSFSGVSPKSLLIAYLHGLFAKLIILNSTHIWNCRFCFLTLVFVTIRPYAFSAVRWWGILGLKFTLMFLAHMCISGKWVLLNIK